MNNIHKILIAVDDAPAAENVAFKGFELGQLLNCEIALLSVVDTTFLSTETGISPRELADIIKNDLGKSQQLLIEKIFKDYKVLSFIEEGKPYEIILKIANKWGADMLITGTHGRTGLSHLLMGSVAEQVLHHAKIPVLIVPLK